MGTRVTSRAEVAKSKEDFLEYLHTGRVDGGFQPYEQHSVDENIEKKRNKVEVSREKQHSYIVEAM